MRSLPQLAAGTWKLDDKPEYILGKLLDSHDFGLSVIVSYPFLTLKLDPGSQFIAIKLRTNIVPLCSGVTVDFTDCTCSQLFLQKLGA